VSFSYKPVRKAARKGSREKTVGHEWRCDECNATVHTEGIIGNAGEENEKQAAGRHARIDKALDKHVCKAAK